eukprot:1084453-Pleurochrysis_carterae.AAC.2
MPPLEISLVGIERGQEKLYVNMLFSLYDVAGELHPPKDDTLRELALTTAQVGKIRRQILVDPELMAKQNFPLSAALQGGNCGARTELQSWNRTRTAQALPSRPASDERYTRQVPTAVQYGASKGVRQGQAVIPCKVGGLLYSIVGSLEDQSGGGEPIGDVGAARARHENGSVGELAGCEEGGEGRSSSRAGVGEYGGAGVMLPTVRRRGRPP